MAQGVAEYRVSVVPPPSAPVPPRPLPDQLVPASASVFACHWCPLNFALVISVDGPAAINGVYACVCVCGRGHCGGGVRMCVAAAAAASACIVRLVSQCIDSTASLIATVNRRYACKASLSI